MNSVTDIWENVLRQLRGSLSETTISTWFDELEIVVSERLPRSWRRTFSQISVTEFNRKHLSR